MIPCIALVDSSNSPKIFHNLYSPDVNSTFSPLNRLASPLAKLTLKGSIKEKVFSERRRIPSLSKNISPLISSNNRSIFFSYNLKLLL